MRACARQRRPHAGTALEPSNASGAMMGRLASTCRAFILISTPKAKGRRSVSWAGPGRLGRGRRRSAAAAGPQTNYRAGGAITPSSFSQAPTPCLCLPPAGCCMPYPRFVPLACSSSSRLLARPVHTRHYAPPLRWALAWAPPHPGLRSAHSLLCSFPLAIGVVTFKTHGLCRSCSCG